MYTLCNPNKVTSWLPSIYSSLRLKPSSKWFIELTTTSIDQLRKKRRKNQALTDLSLTKKNLIINASTLSLWFESQWANWIFWTLPTEKTQFKAKELKVHRLKIDNISFYPTTFFIACPWNSDFIWLTLDFPSGISIFFCPKVSSINSSEIEKDHNLALIDKVKLGNVAKLSKQKFSFPELIMELIWLIQNLHTILSLCFGPSSHSAKFLKDWANHMYSKRLMYESVQASDTTFFS